MSALDRLAVPGARHWGRLPGRPADADPLAEFTGLGRRLRRLRLKEWVGFTLLHPELASSVIIQDAQYLSSSEFYLFDRAAGVLHQHSATSHGGAPALPTVLLEGVCHFQRRGYRISYSFAESSGRHRVEVDLAATTKAPAITGALTLDAAAATAPLSVSSRLPGGRMYTYKAAFPVAGTLRVGGRAFTFDPSRDLAILDEHRSLLPYRTSWLWGTFASLGAGGLVGANFAARPELPGEPEESCLWTPGTCEPLADIAFAPGSADPMAPWHISSADGRLDVAFEPQGRKRVIRQLGLFAIDYYQLFGHYTGTVRGASRTFELSGAPGVCESMKARL